MSAREKMASIRAFARHEWKLAIVLLTLAFFFTLGAPMLGNRAQPALMAIAFAWLLLVILLATFVGVHHAESLAEQLGEPLGTLC